MAVALLALGVLVYLLHPWPRTGADRVRHLIHWPEGCESITVKPPPRASVAAAWRAAEDREEIACQTTGPRVTYARFADARDRDRALARVRPDTRYCVAGREVVTDGLDRGFPRLCAELDGRIVR